MLRMSGVVNQYSMHFNSRHIITDHFCCLWRRLFYGLSHLLQGFFFASGDKVEKYSSTVLNFMPVSIF